jgi:hypothetical protein
MEKYTKARPSEHVFFNFSSSPPYIRDCDIGSFPVWYINGPLHCDMWIVPVIVSSQQDLFQNQRCCSKKKNALLFTKMLHALFVPVIVCILL